MKFFSWDNLLASGVVFLVLGFLPILFTIDFLDPIQNTIQDFNAADIVFSKFKDYDKVEKDTNVVLVNLGYANRKGIARMINIINSYGPRVIGIDSFFKKPKSADGDSALAEALRNTKNLVLVSKCISKDDGKDFDSIITSNIIFNKYAINGFANMITDDNSGFRVVRSISPKQEVNDSMRLFFACEVAKFISPDKVKKFVDRDNDFEYVNYKRNIYNGKYTVFDVDEVLNGSDKLGIIKGKIVLLGFLGPDIKTMVFEDIFFTSMNEHYMGKALPDMYGVIIHANVISQILEEEYIGTLDYWVKILITFIIVYFNMALFLYIESKWVNAYEAANFFITAVEIFMLFTIMIYVFYWFNLNFAFTEATLFGLIFSATGFELYHGSFRPLAISMYKKFSRKSVKMASEKVFADYDNDEVNNKEGKES